MLGPLAQQARIVRRRRALQVRKRQEVREVATDNAMQRARPVFPFLGQGQPTSPCDGHVGALRVVGAPVEAGGVDDAVELVLLALGHDALFGDAVDALPVCVDEVHVRVVEAVEVLLVEAGPLAEAAIPRLQRFGGLELV